MVALCALVPQAFGYFLLLLAFGGYTLYLSFEPTHGVLFIFILIKND
jgi:hypothetical protein